MHDAHDQSTGIQDVLDLIEKKPLGVLDSLDEACRFPTATGATFAEKLYNNKDVMSHKRFEKPKRSNTAFIIDHYAGKVEYQVSFRGCSSSCRPVLRVKSCIIMSWALTSNE